MPTVRFTDVTEAAGIHFKHTSGLSGRKYGVEALGSGAAFFDYNGDGHIDLYVVNGADLPGHVSPQPPRNALYRNRTDGRFVETAAGVADTSYGMGCSAGITTTMEMPISLSPILAPTCSTATKAVASPM